ncbi:MAG: HNH endonuclease signature motif containing protein [Nitrospinota bacterium]|nr:HNH endonuclease signature motif containing protein [Nitrospinota bacterium]
MVLAREPICRICKRAPSSEPDHMIPRRLGGEDTDENLQALCKSCHSRKTAREDGGFGR